MDNIPIRPMPAISQAHDAEFIRARDGDTQIWRLNQHPFDTEIGPEEVMAGRLLEVNTAETRGSTRELGLQHLAWVVKWITDRRARIMADPKIEKEFGKWPFRVIKVQYDKYGGRFDDYVFFRLTGECLNDAIVEAGLSERIDPYDQLRERHRKPPSHDAIKQVIHARVMRGMQDG